MDQPFDAGTLHQLRETVLAHATVAGLPEHRAIDVMLAVNELAANAVRHGGGTGRLRISALPGVLRRQVDDGGSASRKAQASSASQGNPDRMNDGTPSWPYQAGHGLWLVRAIADMMDIQTGSGGSRVAVTFTLPH